MAKVNPDLSAVFDKKKLFLWNQDFTEVAYESDVTDRTPEQEKRWWLKISKTPGNCILLKDFML